MRDRRVGEQRDQRRIKLYVVSRPRWEERNLDDLLDVAEMLTTLPREQSLALVSCYGFGMSYGEASARLG
jgi:DNA-directed RNA polymerase specialized sigma24 family protein